MSFWTVLTNYNHTQARIFEKVYGGILAIFTFKPDLLTIGNPERQTTVFFTGGQGHTPNGKVLCVLDSWVFEWRL